MWRFQDHAALLFDCDGTLADTMPAHYLAWLEVTRAHGMTFDEDRFYAMGGRPTRDIVATLAAEAGLSIDLDHAVHAKERSFLGQLPRVEAIDPVVDVVRRCRGRIPMAVVTGGHRAVCERILAHVEEIAALDLDGVETTARVGVGSGALRVDAPQEGLATADALAAAPRSDEGAFLVPGFVDEG